ncbi:MAG: hypothetical protein ACOX04_02920 [Candidatus Scatomorpha sp.]|jgi:hypothetical protein
MKRKTQRTVSIFVTLLIALLLPVQAFAGEYSIANGNITVTVNGSGEQRVTQLDQGINDDLQVGGKTTITGTSSSHKVTINVADGQTANVTLKDLSINRSGTSNVAALLTGGDGDVNIELDGDNTLQSGQKRAGLEKGNAGTLTIGDDSGASGSLEATGGLSAAGIGGGSHGDGSNITITGGTVTANGRNYAAGIGGGNHGDGSNITIAGGTVSATGGGFGAGIGGGNSGNGSNIMISGGTVTANGGNGGAAIGGGDGGNGSNIEISGGTVSANGGASAAGIGGGSHGDGSGIMISGGTVSANGGASAAGIGGGYQGAGSNIEISGGTVTASGGYCGAGIGGGKDGDGSGVTVSGDAQVRVQGGESYGSDGTGAGIGNGGSKDSSNNPIDGAEVEPDVSNLTAPGWIEYYAPGTEDMDTADPIRIINEEVEPEEPEPEDNPELEPEPEPEPKPYNAPADSAYKIGDKVTVNGREWIIVGIDGDFVELASVDAFTEEQLKDLEALIKTLLTEAQLGKLAADKATGERVFPADENIANEYFGGEKGHITIKADISILG